MGDLFLVLLLVWLWQLVLLGGWALSRRVRKLEKLASPPLYQQMGALRESVNEMHHTGALYAERHGRRLYEIELSMAELVNEMRMLAKQADQMSQTVVRLSRRAGSPGAGAERPRRAERPGRRPPGRPHEDPRAEGSVA